MVEAIKRLDEILKQISEKAETEMDKLNRVLNLSEIDDSELKDDVNAVSYTHLREVTKVMNKLKAADENLDMVVVYDASDQIEGSLSSVFETMIMAVIVSMVIIFLFFGDIKASLIVGTSIPVSYTHLTFGETYPEPEHS